MRTAEWMLLTAAGLAGGLMAGLLIGMPLGQIVNAMIVTAAGSSLLLDAAGLRIGSLAGVMTFVLASGLAFGLLTSWPLATPRAGSRPSS